MRLGFWDDPGEIPGIDPGIDPGDFVPPDEFIPPDFEWPDTGPLPVDTPVEIEVPPSEVQPGDWSGPVDAEGYPIVQIQPSEIYAAADGADFDTDIRALASFQTAPGAGVPPSGGGFYDFVRDIARLYLNYRQQRDQARRTGGRISPPPRPGTVTPAPGGGTARVNPDHSTTITRPDGTSYTVRPDGTIVHGGGLSLSNPWIIGGIALAAGFIVSGALKKRG